MTRGRKPKPIEVKLAEDNPGRRPLPAPLTLEKGLEIEPPTGLGPDGAQLWREMVDQLAPVGALASIDRVVLTAYCQQWDVYVTTEKVLRKQGHYAKGSLGQLVEHPALKIQARAADRLVKLAAELAATPVARARIAAAKAQREQASEFEQITGGDVAEIVIDDVDEIDGSVL